MFSYRTLKGNIEELVNQFGNSGLEDHKDKRSTLIELKNKDIEKFSFSKRIELTFRADSIKKELNYKEPLTVIFDDENEEVNYEIGDAIKKNFIYSLTNKWETEKSIRTVSRYIKEIEEFEIKFSKALYNFTDEEVQQTISELFVNNNYYGVRLRVKACMDMQNMYSKYLNEEIAKSWTTYFKSDTFRTLVNQDDAITVKEIKGIFNILDNAQDGIVPVLIFEGVKLEDVEQDEIRFLEKTDVKDGLILLNKGTDKERSIEVAVDVEDMLNSAIQQKVIITTNKRREYIELLQNNYILRAANLRGKAINEDEPMKYRGVFSRVRHVSEQFNASISQKTMTPRTIRNSGKNYYINKYLTEGYDKWEAFRMTLKRFGEWKYSDGYDAEKRDPYNKQKVDRIKKLWEAYNNGRKKERE